MKLHTLAPNKGAKHKVKRLGCGESSGHGKTSCKGNKGQKARSGSGTRVGFEGGQMPLHRRLPKRGFNNYNFKTKVEVVNLSQLEKAFHDGDTVDEEKLRQAGLINRACEQVKPPSGSRGAMQSRPVSIRSSRMGSTVPQIWQYTRTSGS